MKFDDYMTEQMKDPVFRKAYNRLAFQFWLQRIWISMQIAGRRLFLK